MAYTGADWIRPHSHIGGSTPLMSGLEASSQTAAACPRGTPLVYSSGYLAAATSEAVINVIGISAEDGHNITAGTQTIKYIPTLAVQYWEAKLDATLAIATHLGNHYGLEFDSTYDIWIVDTGEGTAAQKCVTVLDFIDANGTENGWVMFAFSEYGLPNNAIS